MVSAGQTAGPEATHQKQPRAHAWSSTSQAVSQSSDSSGQRSTHDRHAGSHARAAQGSFEVRGTGDA
jgi:hypothetical protein